MTTLQRTVSATPSTGNDRVDGDGILERRIRAEFDEMPGLALTLRQASRLFDVEPCRCAEILGRLVRAGELRTDGVVFFRASEGRTAH